MPQTMLALLAMILASLLAFSQQRNAVSNYDDMVGNEAEMAATGAMMHVLELIGSRSFDERTTPEGINTAGSLPLSANDFSQDGTFGGFDTGECNLQEPFRTPECDDIDDLDGYVGTASALFSSGLTMDFDVEIAVSYVQDGDISAPTTSRTRHKHVIVRASNRLLPHGTIQVERVFSYDPQKAEIDYENVHGALDG
jgi:hypothetical protein